MKPVTTLAAAIALVWGGGALAQAGQGEYEAGQPGMETQQGEQPMSDPMGQPTDQPMTQPPAATTGATAQPGMGALQTLDMQNFAAFDVNGDGSLTPMEFAQFVAASEAPAAGITTSVEQARRDMRGRTSGNAAIQLLNQTSGLFAIADQNGDGRVARDELAMLAQGGMATDTPQGTTMPGQPVPGQPMPGEPMPEGTTMPGTTPGATITPDVPPAPSPY